MPKQSHANYGQSGPLMADVARLAGVAISTVSRALTNPDRVSKKTRSKIDDAAKQLGYTPNAMARSLRAGKSNVILIILPGSLYHGVSQIIPQILQSINRALLRNGYRLMIANLDRDEASETHVLDVAYGSAISGVIILASKLPEVNDRRLQASGLPIVSVLLDMSSQGIASVVTNDRSAIRDATLQLLERGHRSFLYIAGLNGNYHEAERYAGVVEALRSQGLSESAIVRSGGQLGYEHGFRIGTDAAAEFVSLKERPTAVIATSDDMALSFMSRVRDHELTAPNDFSIFSFDGSEVCAFCSPPLSTIVQPTEEMGKAAVELILELIPGTRENSASVYSIPSRFVVRASIKVA